ncbi:MAG: aspartyl-tRNA(Asn)/glutamyl-tRNA (Gln) amidotransferase subunit C [Microgenomates group bacterium Gr01-1014_5]|nr:MAG: aspartyl-tRNA(Asn)/glutamyl-tRNA (Gln) amidotransferase subunit C [Microgenomates group bacterium Gr01-1014_5]
MVKTSGIDVKKVAKLGNLPLSADEERIYTDQLSKVLDYVELLDRADTKNVEPTYNPTESRNSLREDSVKPSLSQEDALSNSPKNTDGFIVTKGVFGEEQ